MPLFCTLKSTYTGTNVPPIEKFSNNGYPLLFEPVKKHLFYANPDDNTGSVDDSSDNSDSSNIDSLAAHPIQFGMDVF